jgi:hypothetical protein
MDLAAVSIGLGDFPRSLDTPHIAVSKRKTAARRRPFLRTMGGGSIGAGEAIRTPDPNLGKVMLYP